jgi:hypothetical protein
VPKNARRITDVEDADAPGLHRGRLTHDARIFLHHLLTLDVLPPCVRVFDIECHHEVARVLGNIEGLQQKAECTNLELCNLVIAPVDGKTEIGIEPFGKLGIPRRDKMS